MEKRMTAINYNQSHQNLIQSFVDVDTDAYFKNNNGISRTVI